MGLEKAIKSGKEKRKPYTKAKAVDTSCRNNGSCLWCYRNRTHKNRKQQEAMEEREREYI